MLIVGYKTKGRPVKSGSFDCPKCNHHRLFVLIEYQRYFTLFFIPVFPYQKVGETVSCSSCKTAYEPYTVLSERDYLSNNSNDSLTEKKAPLIKRGASFLIDYIIITLFLILLAKLLPSPESLESTSALSLFLMGTMIYFTYGVVCEMTLHGRTIGKLALSLSIKQSDGTPLTLKEIFIRNGVKSPFIFFTSVLVFIFIAVREDNKALHDLVAGTNVFVNNQD